MFIRFLPLNKFKLSFKICFVNLKTATFVWPLNMVSASIRHLFYQPMGEKIKSMDSSFSRHRKPYYGEGIVRLANRVAVLHQRNVSDDS